MDASSLPYTSRPAAIIKTYELLPTPNKVMCDVILSLLARISEFKDKTMMTIPSLGAIFGQLLSQRLDNPQRVINIPKANILGKELIEFVGVPLVEQQKKAGLLTNEPKQVPAFSGIKSYVSPIDLITVGDSIKGYVPPEGSLVEDIKEEPSLLPDFSARYYQPSIVVDRKKMLQEKLNRKPPLSMKQKKYLQQMERLLQEEISLIKSKLTTMQDKLKNQKSLKVVMETANKIHDAKCVVVDNKDPSKTHDVIPEDNPSAPDYDKNLTITKKIVESSITTVKQQLTMLQGKITIGSDEEQLQTARNIVEMIQTTVQVLLK